MPLCDAGGYFQNRVNGDNVQINGSGDGWIARFDLDGRLNWSSFFGSKFQDAITSIAVPNSPTSHGPGANNGQVYVCGYVKSPAYNSVNCAQTHVDGFPGCHQGAAHTQGYGGDFDSFVAAFDVSTTLSWSTYLGGTGREQHGFAGQTYGMKVVCDRAGNVFVAGTTNSGAGGSIPVPTLTYTPFYDQPLHGDNATGTYVDGWLYGFSPIGEMLYGSYFGGQEDDYIQALGMGHDRIYIGGVTKSMSSYPLANPVALPGTAWFQGYPVSGYADAHYAQIELLPVLGRERPTASDGALHVFPNPTAGPVRFEWTGQSYEAGRIEVRDATGRLLKSLECESEAGMTNSLATSLHTLPSGYYIGSLIIGDSRTSVKIIRL